MVTALLHAVHALSLPVRMGVDYVSQSQWFYWSCQHSICALESGVFVWQWLHSIEDDAGQSEITGKCSLTARSCHAKVFPSCREAHTVLDTCTRPRGP